MKLPTDRITLLPSMRWDPFQSLFAGIRNFTIRSFHYCWPCNKKHINTCQIALRKAINFAKTPFCTISPNSIAVLFTCNKRNTACVAVLRFLFTWKRVSSLYDKSNVRVRIALPARKDIWDLAVGLYCFQLTEALDTEALTSLCTATS